MFLIFKTSEMKEVSPSHILLYACLVMLIPTRMIATKKINAFSVVLAIMYFVVAGVGLFAMGVAIAVRAFFCAFHAILLMQFFNLVS